MNKFFTHIMLFFAFTTAAAQTSSRPWAADLNFNFREYNGDAGNQFLKFNDAKVQPGLGISRYVNSWLNARLYGNYGNSKYTGTIAGVPNVNFPVNMRALNLGLQGIFKLNNGFILKESARIAPYLGAGVNFWNFNYVAGTKSNTKSMGIPITAGINFNVLPRFNILAQTTFNKQFTDKAEIYRSNKGTGNDNWLQYSVSAVYNFGKGKDAKPAINDADKDGVADEIDRCPTTKKGAKVDEFGCEIVSLEANAQIKGIIKNVLFEVNSDKLKAESELELNKIVDILNMYAGSILMIEGHTDNTGSADYNLDLSTRRANSVKSYLVSKGINTDRLIAKGFGQILPRTSNDTEEGRTLNRRVEMILTKG